MAEVVVRAEPEWAEYTVLRVWSAGEAMDLIDRHPKLVVKTIEQIVHVVFVNPESPDHGGKPWPICLYPNDDGWYPKLVRTVTCRECLEALDNRNLIWWSETQ